MTGPGGGSDQGARLARVGRAAWALLGVTGVLVLLYLVLREVSVVATPLVIALFPAAVLWPVAVRLRRRLPRTLVALLLMVAVFGLVGLALWFIVPRFVARVPDLADSVQQAISDLEGWIAGTGASLPFDIGRGGLEGVAERVFAADAGVDGALDLAVRATELVTSLIVFLVALFFYLRDGERIWAGVVSLLPGAAGRHASRVGGELGWTLGAYFRGQIVIAVVDAVAIGIGLAVIGVPLALPLALLVFLGAFFPIVGAFLSGMVAVLVALADQGLGTALLALAVVVVVQQAEGNLLEPAILSPVLKLHPFLIILVVTTGALVYGVLGAFLAVPAAACLARLVDYARGRPPAAGPVRSADGRRAWGRAAPREDPPPPGGAPVAGPGHGSGERP